MKRTIDYVLIALISLCCGVLCYSEAFFTWDHTFSDYVYQREKVSEASIKIIAIDEKTLQEYGSFGTWSRQRYADLITLLQSNGQPAVIGIDIFFQGEIDNKGDQALAAACQKAGNIFVISYLNFKNSFTYLGNTLQKSDLLHVESIDEPYEALSRVTTHGFSNASIDADGFVRSAYLSVDHDGTATYSFIYKVYEYLMGEQGIQPYVPETDDHHRYGIRYTTKHQGYEVYSFVDVLNQKVDASLFHNSVVLVGAYASGMQDSFYVPSMHDGTQMYGVEVQANILQSLMEQTTWVRMSPMVEAGMNSALCALILCSLRKKSLKIHITVHTLCSIAFVALGVYLFHQGIAISIWYVPFILTLCALLQIIGSYYKEYQRKKALTEVFKRYVAPDIVEELIKEDANITLGGENRNIAILFIDIRGFTTLSEKRTPEQVVDLLNHYLEMVSEAIFAHHGTLDKYIGDAAMAIYNAPLDDDDPIYHAIQSAMDMVKHAKRVNTYAKEQYDVDLGFGIGIHYGEAIVGNIGSSQRMDYTAISDAVNTASRIEGKAKRQQILVSEVVYELMKDRLQFHKAGVFNLKGKEQDVTLYEVVNEEVAG